MVAGAYFIPLYFQYVHQDSALKAAVRLLPFIVVLITCIMLNGGLLPIVGYYYPWFLASGIFTTIGGALMYTVDVDTSTTKIYGYSVLMVASSGLVGQAGYAVAQAKVSLSKGLPSRSVSRNQLHERCAAQVYCTSLDNCGFRVSKRRHS
jgi:hypothetical protein